MITLEKSISIGYFSKDGIDYLKNNYSLEYQNIDKGEERTFSLVDTRDNKSLINSRHYSEIANVGDWDELVRLLTSLEILNSQNVKIEDQFSQTVILPMAKLITSTALSLSGVIDSYTIEVVRRHRLCNRAAHQSNRLKC